MDRILERAAKGEYGEDSEAIGKLVGIVRSATFDKGYGPFICGTMGAKDASGLHDGYLICPAYGADHRTTALFTRANGQLAGLAKPANS